MQKFEPGPSEFAAAIGAMLILALIVVVDEFVNLHRRSRRLNAARKAKKSAKAAERRNR